MPTPLATGGHRLHAYRCNSTRLEQAGFTLRGDGQAPIGRNRDRKPFRMEPTASGADRATGTIVGGG